MVIQDYTLINTIHVLGVPVTTFPHGIGDVFESLMRLLPDGSKRSYYGISKMEEFKKSFILALKRMEKEDRLHQRHIP